MAVFILAYISSPNVDNGPRMLTEGLIYELIWKQPCGTLSIIILLNLSRQAKNFWNMLKVTLLNGRLSKWCLFTTL